MTNMMRRYLARNLTYRITTLFEANGDIMYMGYHKSVSEDIKAVGTDNQCRYVVITRTLLGYLSNSLDK
jgi:hypothetical protein